MLNRPEHPFRMGHHDAETPIPGRQTSNPLNRTIRIIRINFGRLSRIIHKPHTDEPVRQHMMDIRFIGKFRKPLTMRHRNWHATAGHIAKEHGWRVKNFHHGEARLELLGLVAHEMRPMFRPWNDAMQVAHHLAAVTHPQGE